MVFYHILLFVGVLRFDFLIFSDWCFCFLISRHFGSGSPVFTVSFEGVYRVILVGYIRVFEDLDKGGNALCNMSVLLKQSSVEYIR